MLMWLCAAAGTSWLLQFIEDMQQSRAFHETCEQTLPEWQAAKIPEVRSAYWYLQCAAPTYYSRAYIGPVLSEVPGEGSC